MDYKQFNEKFPLIEKCWDGYKQVGMKKKNGKDVPNCVPEEKEVKESKEATPKEDKFHVKLDKLVHKTFGERPDEKKKSCVKEDKTQDIEKFEKDKEKSKKDTKNKDVELNPKIEN